MGFLQDKTFLLKLNRHKIKHYYASIMALDFETENPIARLEGKIVSGSMNIAANSPTRRTGSFQVLFDKDTYNIIEIKNLIAIDKKIALSIGIKNPFFNTPEYRQYGEVLYFKQGIFFITGASASISTSGKSISMNIIDKMGGLNGVCGGTLPASTSFHDCIIIDEKGNQTTEYPIIKDIIFEAVTHFGNENPSRVIIEDIPDTGTQVIQYNGNTPIKIYPNTSGFSRQFKLGNITSRDPEGTKVYFKGSAIGYQETPLTYPGELIQKAGSTVAMLLDTIAKTLGNFEYFYDTEGNFHFRRIKNFQATTNTPLNFQSTVTTEIIDPDGTRRVEEKSIDKELQSLYLPRYSNYEFVNEFADTSLVTSISFQPKWDNIKNDFICWGTKNSNNNSTTMVRYHLAIDERPKDVPAPTGSEVLSAGKTVSLCHKTIYVVKDRTNNKILRYQLNGSIKDSKKEICTVLIRSLDEIFKDYPSDFWFDWREELYRKALLAYGTSIKGSEYDEELLAEWRNIYDPTNMDFKDAWERQFGESSSSNADAWRGYNVNVRIAPNKLRYWLDIIDDASSIGKYSIKRIGKRTKVEENSKINEIFDIEVPPIIFIRNSGDIQQMQESANYYKNRGQYYTFVTDETARNFSLKNSFGTCYESIRSMLNTYLLFNTSVSLTTIPIFYLDVNSIIHLNFSELGIVGDFVMNTISWQIGSSGGTMSVQANEDITII